MFLMIYRPPKSQQLPPPCELACRPRGHQVGRSPFKILDLHFLLAFRCGRMMKKYWVSKPDGQRHSKSALLNLRGRSGNVFFQAAGAADTSTKRAPCSPRADPLGIASARNGYGRASCCRRACSEAHLGQTC